MTDALRDAAGDHNQRRRTMEDAGPPKSVAARSSFTSIEPLNTGRPGKTHRNSNPAVLAERRAKARRDAPVACASCGREVVRHARQQRFCSARCREKARTRVRRPQTGRGSAPSIKNDLRANLPANPPKKDSRFKALQRAKTLSSTRILGPRCVLDAEVFGGREWRPAVSSDGVAIEVSRIRARTLKS
jgi:hypothetical protein